MKLEVDKIVIESRSEIVVLQEMIEVYIASGKAEEPYKKKLGVIKEQLDGLYMSW